jgi:acetyltransferase-like isoleucine patch superfamily enzyme
MSLNERQQRLLEDLHAVQRDLAAGTRRRYQRMNPFFEDLADWHERGRSWLGEDRGVTIYDSATLIGDVDIGEGTWIGPFCMLDGSGGLRIGRHCSISTGAQLLSHDTVRWALSGGLVPAERSPTRIGDRCFVGSHATIVRGVTVGDGSVVGAGAVVVRDVPAGTIVAGLPARQIGVVERTGDRIELRYD